MQKIIINIFPYKIEKKSFAAWCDRGRRTCNMLWCGIKLRKVHCSPHRSSMCKCALLLMDTACFNVSINLQHCHLDSEYINIIWQIYRGKGKKKCILSGEHILIIAKGGRFMRRTQLTAARVQTPCPQRFTLKMVHALCLYPPTPSSSQCALITVRQQWCVCRISTVGLFMVDSWVGGTLAVHIK